MEKKSASSSLHGGEGVGSKVELVCMGDVDMEQVRVGEVVVWLEVIRGRKFWVRLTCWC
jgi:hypothetical protein